MSADNMKHKTQVPGFYVRPAQPSETGLVLEFVRQLAEYERLVHEVKATEAGLQEALFGDSPSAEVVFGCLNDEPVALALFFRNFSTFLGQPGLYLEDLFVKPEFRGRGLGKAMLSFLADLAIKRGCGRLEWCVLDWNQPAIDFYRSIGAREMKGWVIHRLDGQALSALAKRSVLV